MYCFEGFVGVGKMMVVLVFVQVLLCERDVLFGCGSCDVCWCVVILSDLVLMVLLYFDVVMIE